MSDYKFSKELTYLVAATYGPDSMALLDMLDKKGIKPICLFVMYHNATNLDEAVSGMKEYCKQKDLVLEILDTASLPQPDENTPFYRWARLARYNFFIEMYKKYNADGLCLAHCQDDVLAVYLAQQNGQKDHEHFGANVINEFKGMIVIRPLVNYTYEDILEYDRINHVPYSTNMAKYEDMFTRNKVRSEVVDRLNEAERDQIIQQIKDKNVEQDDFFANVGAKADFGDELNIREIFALSKDEFAETMVKFVNTKGVHLKSSDLDAIRNMCLDGKPTSSLHLAKHVYLIKTWDTLSLGTNPEALPYTYVLEKPGKLDTDVFSLDFSKGAEDRNIKESDYPLTIRTALPEDVTDIGGYLTRIKEVYIEEEMPLRLRAIWPVFLNKKGKIIYVPRYKRGFVEYHRLSKLTIKVKDEEK